MSEQVQVKRSEYEVTDYGIDGSQYFQGHGVSYTEYDQCSLGVGESFNEAYHDALEQAAMMGFDIDNDPSELATKEQNKSCSVSSYLENQGESEEDQVDSELYYYVGLRW